MPSAETEIPDVAIIGAGVSGAYCAYRLTRDSKCAVEVVEAEERIGGRLWTYDWKEAGAQVELGGEGFAALHASVFRLARGELGLTVVPHDPFNRLLRLHLRGRLIRPEDMADPANFPGDGPANEVKLRYSVGDDYFTPDPEDPSKLTGDPFTVVALRLLKLMSQDVRDAYFDVLGRIEARIGEFGGRPLTAEDAESFVTPEIFRGIADLSRAVERSDVELSAFADRKMGGLRQPARDLGLWSVLVEELGPEAYELFLEAGFENSSARQFNLVEMAQALLLGGLMMMAQPTFWSIEGGFDRLPKELMRQAERGGARIRLGRRVVAIRREKRDGSLTLTLRGADDEEETVRARRVICTTPLACFDNGMALEGFDPKLTEAFRVRRKAVAAINAGKLFMVYPRPWWTEMTDLGEAPPEQGFAASSMPVRAVYYQGLCADGRRGLMTGALTDGVNNDFWTGFLSPHAAMFPGPAPAKRQVLAIPATMAEACHKMLVEMHASAMPAPPPDPEAALYKAWRGVGGGWSAWKSGRDIHAEAAALRRPFADGGSDQGLSCCGDSVAERHGWVEETLQSAETMLREAFGLVPAPWLPDPAES